MGIEGIPSATIHSEIAAKLNFACHQSAFAFLRDLRIDNDDLEARMDDVLVTLTSDPAFLKPKSWRLDRIAPEGSVSIPNRDVELDGSFLLNLADSIRGSITITVEKDGLVIAEETKPVELLAYNEWGAPVICRNCLPHSPCQTTRRSSEFYVMRALSSERQGSMTGSMDTNRGAASAFGKSPQRYTRPSRISISPTRCRPKVLKRMAKKSGCRAKSWKTALRRAWIPPCCLPRHWSRPVLIP